VQLTGGAARRILEPLRLLEEWVTHYHTTLRPKLHPRRFDAGADMIEKVDLKPYGAYWGGEVAADKLVHALKPATFTIYAREPLAGLVAGLRLRARPGGSVEILDAFWNFARSSAVRTWRLQSWHTRTFSRHGRPQHRSRDSHL